MQDNFEGLATFTGYLVVGIVVACVATIIIIVLQKSKLKNLILEEKQNDTDTN